VPSGDLPEKVRLILFVPNQQPSVPSAADLSAPITDLPHLLFVAAPVPPELRVGADLDGVHPFGNGERLNFGAHASPLLVYFA
jgi:hypothetical protein